jgi:hypothetical protein
MQMSRTSKTGLAGLALAILAGVTLSPAPAQACSARFSCSPGVSPICSFRIFYGNGTGRTLTVPAGGAQTIYGLQRGATFCTSNRMMPSTDCNARAVRMQC